MFLGGYKEINWMKWIEKSQIFEFQRYLFSDNMENFINPFSRKVKMISFFNVLANLMGNTRWFLLKAKGAIHRCSVG